MKRKTRKQLRRHAVLARLRQAPDLPNTCYRALRIASSRDLEIYPYSDAVIGGGHGYFPGL